MCQTYGNRVFGFCTSLIRPYPLVVLTVSLLMVSLASSVTVWQAVFAGYKGDSLYTLGVASQIGLIVLCLAFCLLTFLLKLSLTQSLIKLLRPSSYKQLLVCFGLDGGLTLGLSWAALTAAPQVFYVYYLMIFDGLPMQWVISPLTASEWINLALIDGKPTLSHHVQGALIRGLFGLFLFVYLWPAVRKNTADK